MVKLLVLDGAPVILNRTEKMEVPSGNVVVPPVVSSQETARMPLLLIPRLKLPPTLMPARPNAGSTLRNVTTLVFQWKENCNVPMPTNELARMGTTTSFPGSPLVTGTVNITGSEPTEAPSVLKALAPSLFSLAL